MLLFKSLVHINLRHVVACRREVYIVLTGDFRVAIEQVYDQNNAKFILCTFLWACWARIGDFGISIAVVPWTIRNYLLKNKNESMWLPFCYVPKFSAEDPLRCVWVALVCIVQGNCSVYVFLTADIAYMYVLVNLRLLACRLACVGYMILLLCLQHVQQVVKVYYLFYSV